MEYYYCFINSFSSSNNLLFIYKIKMTQQVNKKILFIILILISLSLFSAFFIEYKLGHKPCKLCLYERIPYFLSILLIAKIFLIKNFEKITLLLLSIVFIVSSILAFYHFGIERGFFSENLSCISNDAFSTTSKEELLKQLKQNNISCKNVSFTMFGLSLAAINTIFSFCLSVIFMRMFVNYGKN
tara:strand:+ start:395 stop:949 length:555 start_codon:yes stop_codon:yes gene_type:complete